MATDDNQVDDTTGDDGEGESGSKLRSYIKDLEKKNKTLEEENSGYKRNDQLRNAGLGDLTERQIKALAGAHDGEDKPEEWRKTAEELGFVKPETETSSDDQQAQERITGASQSGTTNPKVSSEDEYAAAKTPKEVMAVAKKHGSVVASDYE